MHRTNIYLTEEQVRALDAEAQQTGTTRSDIIREAIDEHISTTPVTVGPAVAAALDELGGRWDELVGDLFQDDPDLRIERADDRPTAEDSGPPAELERIRALRDLDQLEISLQRAVGEARIRGRYREIWATISDEIEALRRDLAQQDRP